MPVPPQAHYRDYGKMTYARSVMVIHNMAHQGRGPHGRAGPPWKSRPTTSTWCAPSRTSLHSVVSLCAALLRGPSSVPTHARRKCTACCCLMLHLPGTHHWLSLERLTCQHMFLPHHRTFLSVLVPAVLPGRPDRRRPHELLQGGPHPGTPHRRRLPRVKTSPCDKRALRAIVKRVSMAEGSRLALYLHLHSHAAIFLQLFPNSRESCTTLNLV